MERNFLDKGPEAPCSVNTLEKSGLEPSTPNRLADHKQCALSTQPNPHLRRWGEISLTFQSINLAELIFRSSRPVFCKNTGNDSGKQRSLHVHAPRKFSSTAFSRNRLFLPNVSPCGFVRDLGKERARRELSLFLSV